jgi:segregation and condensation protein A
MELSSDDAVEIEQLAIEPVGAPGLADPSSESGEPGAFRVRLENFEGPFDLLLTLIGKHQLDVTEVALSQVTDEFIAYLTAAGQWDLGQATEFLVVAATLLDLKTARLLPAAEVEDEEDLALLEARDLLFARLLQYRAYKLAAAHLAELERRQGRRHGRNAELEARFAELLPEVLIGVPPQRLAELAALALKPKPAPTVATEHVHAPRVSVREQMMILRDRLRRCGAATFRSLVGDCAATLEVVGRFLALLELYRDGAVAFDQAAALSELRIRWLEAAPGDAGPRRPGTGGEDDQDSDSDSGGDIDSDSDIDREYG